MKVGDYVRIKDGLYTCIGKIKRFEQTNCLHIIIDYSNNEDFNESDWFEWNVIKSSPNILGLIEVGDLINKKEVVKIIHFEGDTFYRIELFGGKAIMNIKDIKSIITKEQIESMEYKVGK